MRREDIPVPAAFRPPVCGAARHPVAELASDTLSHLVAYDCPGNVRELRNVAERLIVRSRGVLTTEDLTPEILQYSRPIGATSVPADDLFNRLVTNRESFWSVVYPAFMARDLTRADLRTILQDGLQRTGGSYKVRVVPRPLSHVQDGAAVRDRSPRRTRRVIIGRSRTISLPLP